MDALEVVVVVVVALAGLLFRVYMRGGFGADADELKRKHKEMDSPRWERKGPQLVGRACAQCHQRIIFQVDATQCSRCAEPVHLACADRHTQAHGGP
jgi:hypothetical protein